MKQLYKQNKQMKNLEHEVILEIRKRSFKIGAVAGVVSKKYADKSDQQIKNLPNFDVVMSVAKEGWSIEQALTYL